MFEKYVDGLIDKSRAAIPTNDVDYIGEDGLLYCGLCHTPKQCRITLMGKEKTPPCLCKCGTEKRDRDHAFIKGAQYVQDYYHFRQHQAKDDYDCLVWLNNRDCSIHPELASEQKRLMRAVCFGEDKFLNWTFANDDGANEKVSAIMRNYAENFHTMRENGKGLLLFGEVGTGKSYAAACVANYLVDSGVPVLMTNFSYIENRVQESFEGRQEYYDSLNRFPLLIIDDLAVERKTEYMQQIVYNVIDGRCRSGLPLIVTTNLTSDALKHPSDMTNARTFSRLFDMCIPVEVKGEDRRRERLKEDYKEYKDILGL